MSDTRRECVKCGYVCDPSNYMLARGPAFKISHQFRKQHQPPSARLPLPDLERLGIECPVCGWSWVVPCKDAKKPADSSSTDYCEGWSKGYYQGHRTAVEQVHSLDHEAHTTRRMFEEGNQRTQDHDRGWNAAIDALVVSAPFPFRGFMAEHKR